MKPHPHCENEEKYYLKRDLAKSGRDTNLSSSHSAVEPLNNEVLGIINNYSTSARWI